MQDVDDLNVISTPKTVWKSKYFFIFLIKLKYYKSQIVDMPLLHLSQRFKQSIEAHSFGIHKENQEGSEVISFMDSKWKRFWK